MKKRKKIYNSEFGRGCVYCLGLFLAHQHRYYEYVKEIHSLGKSQQEVIDFMRKDAASMWFNAASDHLFELEIPESASEALKRRLTLFRAKCIDFGHGKDMFKAKEEDVKWAIREAKDLLIYLDRNHIKVRVERGEWE